MSALPVDPIANPQAWDVVVIAGVASPGVCKVSDCKRAHEWDVKKGKGTYGSTTTFVGRPPAKFSVTFKAWTSAIFAQWASFLPLLKYDPTKKTAQAVSLYHPSLVELDLGNVVTESIGNWVHDGEGMYSRVVEFIEYFPAPKASAVSTPTTSNTNDPTNQAGTPVDPEVKKAQDEFAASLSDAKNLGPL
ncbi:MAG: hypothetical protein NVS3B10_00110 [Polyangiales bacterium]